MLFILTIGYIDKVYKSVSGKGKPTHQTVVNACLFLFMVVSLTEMLESTADTSFISLLLLLLFTDQTSSGLVALSALYKVKIYLFICLFLQSGACWSLVSLLGTETMTYVQRPYLPQLIKSVYTFIK